MHLRLVTYKLRSSEAKFNYDAEGRDALLAAFTFPSLTQQKLIASIIMIVMSIFRCRLGGSRFISQIIGLRHEKTVDVRAPCNNNDAEHFANVTDPEQTIFLYLKIRDCPRYISYYFDNFSEMRAERF